MKKRFILLITLLIISMILVSCINNKAKKIFKDYNLETEKIVLSDWFLEDGKRIELTDAKEIENITKALKKIEYTKLTGENIYKLAMPYEMKFNDEISIYFEPSTGLRIISIKGEEGIQYEAEDKDVEEINSLLKDYIKEIEKYNEYRTDLKECDFTTDKIELFVLYDENIISEIRNKEDINEIIDNFKLFKYRKLDDAPLEIAMEYKIKFNENLSIYCSGNLDVIKINDEKSQYLLNNIFETEVNRLKGILDKYIK